MADRAAYQRVFQLVNSRLHDLSDESCREIEYEQTRALKLMPRPEMLRQLISRMKDEPPSPRWKDRCHHTMRRLFTSMLKDDERLDAFQTAINGYLDGQTELAATWLTAEVFLRPWGER